MFPRGTNVDSIKLAASFTFVNSATNGQQIIGTNPRRVTLLITTQTTTHVEISPVGTMGGSSDGMTISSAAPLELTLEKHGSAVQMAWFNKGAGNSFGILEVTDENLVQQ